MTALLAFWPFAAVGAALVFGVIVSRRDRQIPNVVAPVESDAEWLDPWPADPKPDELDREWRHLSERMGGGWT